ncbi:aminoglycoside phosphotransferase family protein [Blastopirellula sp. J2-11]|uniref:aminoglycoside phosphotransferase family protein n=1 Tax=Blastopirellula sp. J2-11 TaxID=2943192 RepID=UPI0021C647C7|nr:aminoglycoside phosphotransferase family protein [Blastopirellula sp. J2-11]UUO05084.1 aminoglycoside phosphotransferase family protein [Blastopirellula sp. J2-11]
MFDNPDQSQNLSKTGEIAEASELLPRFPELLRQPCQITSLGSAGGLSGGAIWRIESDRRFYALRRWPAETTSSRLRFVHSLQHRWRESNLKFIPKLYTTVEGESFTENASEFWELAEWMPGAVLQKDTISPQQQDAVAAAIAAIHQAAAQHASSLEPSPGLQQRLAMLQRWRTIDKTMVNDAIERLAWPEFAVIAQQTLQSFAYASTTIGGELQAAVSTPLPLHACLRDIHRDHIFLTGALVTGVIDFGAVRIESRAGDLARICGSLFEDDRNRWEDFLARYERLRPLSAAERRAITVFDRSAVLLTGLQWIEWIALERRQFPDPAAVLSRLDISLRRLQFLLK